MTGITSRIAGAPITWGVCEVPGWGYQLGAERVLTEMALAGMVATELGPGGFLPEEPWALARLLHNHGLQLVGGFVPLVLHDLSRRDQAVAAAEQVVKQLSAAGAKMIVLAADTGLTGYERSLNLDAAGWRCLADTIGRIEELAARHELALTLHPHYGTAIENPEQVDRLLNASPVALCLDTGHYLVGGGDPALLAKAAADRITHTHLKDVNSELAEHVRAGRLSYRGAVQNGLYKPLGEGDVDLTAIVSTLEAGGYRGWYVLEQDTVLSDEPPLGQGPVEAAMHNVRFLAALHKAI